MPSKKENQTEHTLGFLLNDVGRLMRRNLNRRVQDLGLTQVQWRALLYLSREEGARQNQLAEILDVQPISVARLVDRMEATGWIVRRRDPNDRRAFNLYLTEKVAPILEQVQQKATLVTDETVKGIPEDEQQRMMAYLRKIRENLTE